MKTTAKDQNTESTKLEAQQLEASEIAQLIVEVASEKLASDIVMLDLRGLASFTDYFVVMSADSSRLIQALEDDILSTLKESKLSMHRREGSAASGWVLMDCSDVIVHIFGPEEREFFGLERLWARAPQVVRILYRPGVLSTFLKREGHPELTGCPSLYDHYRL